MTHNHVSFSTVGEKRPFINMPIMGKDSRFQMVRLLADTGNDVSLINFETAAQLGFDENDGTIFRVAGISQQAQQFRMVKTYIKIGNTKPRKIRLGIGPLKDNLLGREDIFPYYNVEYTPTAVIFRERHSAWDFSGFT